MKYSIEINKIIEGALKLDRLKVESYTKLLIEKLIEDEDIRAANRLEKLINKATEKKMIAMGSSDSSKIPVDSESRIAMAEVITPNDEVSLVLSRSNNNEIEDFLLSYKKSDELYEAGLDVPNTLLLYGPPGCGKTKSAEYIAYKLKLPLIIARLDSMISSYLGTTSKNIRNLFEYVQKVPCILFLDEFDAIAKARDDNNELGELKRVVNSLLQNIDSLRGNTLLIAATNHESLLDNAIWRRFNYKLEIGFPDYNAKRELIKLFSKNFIKLDEKELDLIALALEEISGAEIERIIKSAIRKSIIYEYNLAISNIFDEIFLSKKNNFKTEYSIKEKAIYLRNIDDKLFSYSNIAKVLDVSKTNIAYIMKNRDI